MLHSDASTPSAQRTSTVLQYVAVPCVAVCGSALQSFTPPQRPPLRAQVCACHTCFQRVISHVLTSLAYDSVTSHISDMTHPQVTCPACILHDALTRDTTHSYLSSVTRLKLQVLFAKEPHKRDNILQKRPIILRSLLNRCHPIRANGQCITHLTWGHHVILHHTHDIASHTRQCITHSYLSSVTRLIHMRDVTQ